MKQGSLVLDCKKVDLCNDSVYIISEVVYAEKVIIDVQISTKEKFGENTVEIDSKIPVAFSYLKFPVDKSGVLLAAKSLFNCNTNVLNHSKFLSTTKVHGRIISQTQHPI